MSLSWKADRDPSPGHAGAEPVAGRGLFLQEMALALSTRVSRPRGNANAF